ncbi:Zn(2)-Cys(6) binuclear cluster domain-containing protein [Roridomyces roridus]|uniref:Zn(2)-Cys(6) binuclear cluster domain-containing protein n=1 Tax=Roridomyces roridus TaxID=1738132 RepID=A0AAD7BNN9_9AGAR|nr:Zn(2)-Cys(6) binuclear cluster domain-containing protein [Roridomyces roridus]
MEKNQISFASNSMTPLQKGKACVNCRRRKIKCDGDKPICGPCAKFSTTFGDCEYSEDGISHAQMLEDQISILQARIEELERPKQSRPSRPSSTRHHSSSSSSQVSSSNMSLGPLLSQFYMQQASRNPEMNSMPAELPFIVLEALVHNFLHHSSCFGFFLDTQAFHDSITHSQGRDLPPVLLNVMYLWGVHLSQDARIKAYEATFLALALRSTAGSLSGTHPRTILHSLQASVLLAYYFIRNARFVEGKYHTSAAVSIAVSSGLQQIRAPQRHGSGLTVGMGAPALRPPRDAGEEGERISAFWTVLTLNNCWAGTDGSPSNVSYEGSSGLKIDTPWPLDRDDYVQFPHLLPLQNTDTIIKFLADVPDYNTSKAAMHAKAGVLFEEATRLATRYRMLKQFESALATLDRKIDAFKTTLPAVQCRDMLVVHMLAHGATIHLHKALAHQNMGSRVKALEAARAMAGVLRQIDVQRIGLIDPVLAPLWTSACLTFISEIKRGRQRMHDAASPSQIQAMTGALHTVIGVMEFFAPFCRLMDVQLAAVRLSYNDAFAG